jgi:hypothetical protein
MNEEIIFFFVFVGNPGCLGQLMRTTTNLRIHLTPYKLSKQIRYYESNKHAKGRKPREIIFLSWYMTRCHFKKRIVSPCMLHTLASSHVLSLGCRSVGGTNSFTGILLF